MACRGLCGCGRRRARRFRPVRSASFSPPDGRLHSRPAALSQDYLRLVQTPLCCESRLLPDSDTLRDRMTATAYEEGLPEGVEGRASALVQGAMEVRRWLRSG